MEIGDAQGAATRKRRDEMFTGIVQRIGRLESIGRVTTGWSLEIAHEPWPEELVPGESVAVQGACLTVTVCGSGLFKADLLDETLAHSAMRDFKMGDRVNLERALALGERLGGHLVSGHIDEAGQLQRIEQRGRDVLWRIACSPQLARLSVLKGSIAIDGVSLTISGLGDDWLEVNLIPHTLEITTLGGRKAGDRINLEADILGKYVARLLGRDQGGGITAQLLEEQGFL